LEHYTTDVAEGFIVIVTRAVNMNS